jgi:hypothetical protein
MLSSKPVRFFGILGLAALLGGPVTVQDAAAQTSSTTGASAERGQTRAQASSQRRGAPVRRNSATARSRTTPTAQQSGATSGGGQHN